MIRALMLAALLTANAFAQDELASVFDSDSLVIEANEFGCFSFDIYIARDMAQQRRGLMHVRHLPATSGMLFVYDRDAFHSMWMKNTYVPLDILFIRSDGVVSSIANNTEPLSLTSIRSKEAVRFVLELNAGITQDLGIGAGAVLHLDTVSALQDGRD